jgi:hypothetical protein
MITDTEMEIARIRLAQSYFDAWLAYRRQALGLPAESPNPQADWNALVNAKVAAGMSRVEALKVVAKEQPNLYAAQSIPKSEYRVN